MEVEPAIVQHRVGPETARLRMRAFEPDDAAAFHVLSSHPDVIRYVGNTPTASVHACRQAIIDYPDFKVYGFGRWACIDKSTSQVIGMCGMKYLTDWQVVDLGYRFLPDYWGRGLATEAGTASLDFAFSTLGLAAVDGFAEPANGASCRVLEKLAMRRIGEVVYDGDPAVRYRLTAAQWAGRLR